MARFSRKKKFCRFSLLEKETGKKVSVDYKDLDVLQQYVKEIILCT